MITEAKEWTVTCRNPAGLTLADLAAELHSIANEITRGAWEPLLREGVIVPASSGDGTQPQPDHDTTAREIAMAVVDVAISVKRGNLAEVNAAQCRLVDALASR